MTELEPSPAPVDTWEAILDALRRRYPGQKDSVLFCIHKLQQNPDISLRDFRAEADLYGIPVAGRALHSAKSLLGLVKTADEPAATARSNGAETEADRPGSRRRRVAEPAADGSIEDRVVAAVRQIQSAAGAEAQQMRNAIRQAIAILQKALDQS